MQNIPATKHLEMQNKNADLNSENRKRNSQQLIIRKSLKARGWAGMEGKEVGQLHISSGIKPEPQTGFYLRERGMRKVLPTNLNSWQQ